MGVVMREGVNGCGHEISECAHYEQIGGLADPLVQTGKEWGGEQERSGEEE